MANPVTINPTLTLAGQAAAFNASNNGLSLTIDAVSFGRAHYDPTGDEVALVDPVGSKVPVAGASRPTPYQIRMVSAWREDVGEVPVGEIAFWAGDVLAFVWSKADGTVASYKTDGVTYVLFNDLAFSQVPANSVSFNVDPTESVALAALAAHEGATNAHPQYVLRAKFPDYQGHLWGEVGGTANGITLALPAIVELTEYILGNRFTFKAAYSNTGATTINIDGVGAVPVLKTGGVPLTAGSIIAGGVYDVYYDGASFQLTAGAGFASAEATEAEVLDTTETSDSTSWVSVRRLLKALFKKAPLKDPVFTGIPKVPTAALNANTDQAASTAFVLAQINDSLPTFAAGDTTTDWNTITTRGWFKNLLSGPSTPNSPGSAAPYWYCHVLRYLANCTQIAYPYGTPSATGLIAHRSLYQGTWTEWSISYGSGSVSAVVRQFMAATTQAAALTALGAAPLASPVFTGDPKAPTPALLDNDTSVATTAFVRSILGYFGVGQAGEPSETDMNKYTTPGNYITPQGGLTNLPPGWSSNTRYSLVVDGFGATRYLVQTITTGLAQGVDIDQAQRTMSAAGVWSPWRSVWNGNNTPKQTSPIDTTLGAMLTVGAFGLGSPDTPLITDFSVDLRPGFYRAYTSGSPKASIGAPPDTGNTSMSVLVGGGYVTDGYKTFLAIINAYAVTRVFVGVKVTAGEQPIWTEITQNSQLPYRGVQSYKAAGVYTWTVPAGVKKAWVTVLGAGGGGGSSEAANNLGSAGGGGGGLSQRLVDLTGVTSVSVTVGAGGAGSTTPGTTGGSGGTSSFGAYLSATGGAGGGGNSTVGNAPGNSGRGSGGDYNSALGVGAPNYGMNGGSGGGPGPRATQGAVPGNMALDSGGGGSGAYPGQSGGNGAAGSVEIKW